MRIQGGRDSYASLAPDRSSHNLSKPFTTPPQRLCLPPPHGGRPSIRRFLPHPPKTRSRYTLVFISKWHAKIKHGSQRTEKQQCDVFRVKARTCSEVIRALGCYSTALIRSSKPCEINNAAAETGNQDCAACTNQSVLSRNSLHYTRLKRCYASNAPDTLKTFTAMHYS